jgi:5-methylcytosine-specific restriction enzyme B
MAYWLWTIPAEHYPVYRRTGTFAVRRQGRSATGRIRPGDRIVAYLSGRRVVAGLFEATSAAFEDATPLVRGGHYRHRVRVRPLVEVDEEVWLPYDAFAERLAVLDEYSDRGDPDRRFRAVVQQVIHPLPEIDGKVLEFLVRARAGSDFPALQSALDAVRRAQDTRTNVAEPPARYVAPPSRGDWDRAAALEHLVATIEEAGYVYQPWHVAAYVTALRTKPFVILAGITGVGKSRLPVLVAEATGGLARTIPVRPDWTDPAEVLGYTDLQGTFRPGALLHAAIEATADPDRFHVAVLDEMNLARPEHYLAEVLSRIEARRPVATSGGYASEPFLDGGGVPEVGFPPNLGLVGTVNMDESAFGFSRKVLDRAFTLELGEVDLGRWTDARSGLRSDWWPPEAWHPLGLRLAELLDLNPEERRTVDQVVATIIEANRNLGPAGLGIGYRSRDEVALFVLHALATREAFRSRMGEPVDPLDLALMMKLLPRLEGSSRTLQRALFGLLGWARGREAVRSSDDAREAVEAFDRMGRPAALADARYPRTAARLTLMTARLLEEGYASFWER